MYITNIASYLYTNICDCTNFKRKVDLKLNFDVSHIKEK